ncbi:MAG: type III-A CRISPR-associated RAMP protein Csm5 [Thermoanaerobacteraceae bacterium]|nr:type III-A CRISPR-associated RAMP protein Csm5 [Thermoanaerobacteraceae bacterium]
MRGKMRYELEVLTPVHVGSGDRLLPSDYVIDSDSQTVVRVDMESMLRDSRFLVDRFIYAVKQQGFSLHKEFKNFALKHPKYRFTGPGTVAELTRYLGRSAGNILEHIKEGGKPYLPGSSLKGAIRSLLLRYLVSLNPLPYEEAIADQLKARREKKNTKKEFFSTPAEERVLGRTNFSLLRALQVGDSSTIDPSDLELACVKVLSLVRRGFCWKDLGKRANVDSYEDATPIFFEALPSGTVVTGFLKIDGDLLQKEVASELGYRSQGIKAITDLTGVCRKETRKLLDKELEFFQGIRLKPCIDAVEKLISELASCRENQMIIPLAWGTGYRAKAAGWVIDAEHFKKVRDEFNLGRDGFEFPKTRKVVFYHGKPHGLVGWVRITLG